MRIFCILLLPLLFFSSSSFAEEGNYYKGKVPPSCLGWMQSRIYPLHYADAKSLEEVVKKFLSPQGSVASEMRTNSLILFDYPEVLNRVDAVIGRLDVKMKDVMVEVYLLETTYARLEEVGFVFRSNQDGQLMYEGPVQIQSTSEGVKVNAGQLGITPGIVPAAVKSILLDAFQKDKKTKWYTVQKVRIQSHVQGEIKLTSNTPIQVADFVCGKNGVLVHKSEVKRVLAGRLVKVKPVVRPQDVIVLDIQTEIIAEERGQYYATTFDPFSRFTITQMQIRDGDMIAWGTDVMQVSSQSTKGTDAGALSADFQERARSRIFVVLISAISV